MSSSIRHQCLYCRHIIGGRPTSLATPEENSQCNQCCLSITESTSMQDDLAILFTRHMNIETLTPTAGQQLSTASPSKHLSIPYSISQHYHHSSHLAPQATATSRSPHGVLQFGSGQPVLTISDILRSHNIDPLRFTPSQLALFENAGDEQRSRLIQIWQLFSEGGANSSPGNAREGGSDGLKQPMEPRGSSGFMEQYWQPSQPHPEDLEMQDSHRQGDNDDTQQYAEPYMASGYENMISRKGYDHNGTNTEPEFAMLGSANLPNEPTSGFPYSISTDPVYQSQRRWEFA